MATAGLDQMSAREIVAIMNAEDKKVPEAVQEALPQVAAAAELGAKAILSGGRIIYVGAGTSGRLGVLDAVECVPTFGVPEDQVIALMAGGPGAFLRAAEGVEDDEAAGPGEGGGVPGGPGHRRGGQRQDPLRLRRPGARQSGGVPHRGCHMQPPYPHGAHRGAGH